jgi:hypothetical protein
LRRLFEFFAIISADAAKKRFRINHALTTHAFNQIHQFWLAVGCVMRLRLGHKHFSTATRLAVASATAVLLAGCSGDVTRFASNPFEMDPAPTASIRQAAIGRIRR